MKPFASTLIGVLQGTLDFVEKSGHVPEDSQALKDFRTAVVELIRELETAAKREPRIELVQPADEDFYRKRV